MARHHNDPVRKIYRFRDMVHDAGDHRLPVRLPDLKQEILHDRARQQIERAKWLVRSRTVGLIANTLAMEARCRMPPESWAGI